MVTTKYYIEDLATGKCLQSVGEAETWKQFEPTTNNATCTAREFANEATALSHIDTLPNGEYKIFTRIVKS
jgi:hypothetical protein